MTIDFIARLFRGTGRSRRARMLFLAAMTATALSIAALPAYGAEAEPTPGVIAVIDRTAIELSGLTTLSQLLSNRSGFNVFGIQGLSASIGGSYLVDGRPVSGLDFSTFPLSSVERIELLEEGATRFRGHIGDGTINIVLRRGFDGTEVSGDFGRPIHPGVDSAGGSALWGGRLGRGRILIGIDHVFSEEVREADRDYTRAKYTDTLAGSQGISISGNTLFVGNDQYALGDCDPAVYTGPLRSGSGEACGYAYADTAWLDSYPRTKRDSLFLHADYPLKDGGELYFDTLISQTSTRYIWAPPAEFFTFGVSGDSPAKLALEAAVPGLEIPEDGSVSVAHRFVGHGNRDWRWNWDDINLTFGFRGKLTNGVGYDTHIRYYRSHGVENAETFVSQELAEEAVLSGDYDIVNPLSTEPAHLEAIRRTALRKTRDSDTETWLVRTAFDGSAFALPAGPVRWTAAIQFEDYAFRDITDHRDTENRSYETTAVLGGSGSNVVADRQVASAQVGASLPLLAGLDLILTGRGNDYNDIGGILGGRVAGHYRPNDALAFRVHSDYGQFSPSVRQLYESASKNFPYVRDCKEYLGDREACVSEVSPGQVTNENVGNPNLDPSEAKAVGVGATFRFGTMSLAADWYRQESWNRPSRPSAQSIVDMENRDESLPEGAEVVRVGGTRTGKILKLVTPLFNRMDNDARSEGIALRAGVPWETEWVALNFDVNVLRTLDSESRVAGVKQPGDFPRYRAHAVLRASRGDVTVSWNVHSVSGYWNATRTGRWKSWMGHDLALQWRDAFGRAGLKVSGGVINVGDREPSLNPANPNSPALSYDSVRGRTFFLNAGMVW